MVQICQKYESLCENCASNDGEASLYFLSKFIVAGRRLELDAAFEHSRSNQLDAISADKLKIIDRLNYEHSTRLGIERDLIKFRKYSRNKFLIFLLGAAFKSLRESTQRMEEIYR